jgi:hypothetical protein
MGLVRSDVSTEGCVHVVFQLTLLKSRPDEWRHSANESQAGVGICRGSCCSIEEAAARCRCRMKLVSHPTNLHARYVHII